MFFSFSAPRSADREIEPSLDLPKASSEMTNPSGLGDPLQARGDIDAIAHQVAVAFLDHVAEMNADPKLDALFERDACVALDHGVLHFDRAAHRVDNAAELDDAAVAGALDDTAMVHGDCGINQVTTERPQPRQESGPRPRPQAAE